MGQVLYRVAVLERAEVLEGVDLAREEWVAPEQV